MGDHLFPQVYKADYRMWLPLISNDHKNIAEPYEGGGEGSGKFHRDSSEILQSPFFPPPPVISNE